MRKFGVLLNSRPAGREAALRLFQIINGSSDANDKEKIILDFTGVEILTPSFADELLHRVKEKYGTGRILIENTETSAVKDTIEAVRNEPPHNS